MDSETPQTVTASMESPTQRLRALLADRLGRLEEWRFARRVCAESLAAYRALREAQPELKGDALYEAVIARRLNLDAANARAIMRRTHASVEDWENDREPQFIDVVKYMIVSEYLGQEAAEVGMRIDLGAFLTQRIDPRL
jgi:hypothetical protein